MSVSTLANATLIDNGDYSTDTESGLDWLDWSLTVDKTQAEALAMYGSAGWRIATQVETTGLIENFFGIRFGTAENIILDSKKNSAVYTTSFVALFGNTIKRYTVSAVTIEGEGMFAVDATYNKLYSKDTRYNYASIDYSSYNFGVPLVKANAVSEPAIISLFALGFVGIGFARRRQS